MTKPQRSGQNLWIDTEDGFIGAAWYWPSEGAAASTAVVIVPGIVHEERAMSGGLVAFAEALANAGLPALLMDLHGCSQSAGRIEDADIGARWRANIKAAVRHARGTGTSRVIVVGVRLGFSLAVEALADEPLAALIAWAPIASGKRYVRELKLLQRAVDTEAAAAGTIAIGGFSIPATVLECISELDLAKIETPNTSHLLFREMAEGLDTSWLASWRERGLKVETQPSTEVHSWLFSDSDQPELPHKDIQALAHWCRALHNEQAVAAESALTQPAPRPTIEFFHQGRLIRETFVEFGPSGLTGVMSEPVKAARDNPTRLLMSTVGPGRTFTDFARDEASRGNRSLRFDFAGFGTSGRGNSVQGGVLYTDQGSHDVQAAIAYLRQTGHKQIYALGFCAGAWSMLQAGVAPELSATVAINVALYRQPGPPIKKLAKRTRRRLLHLAPAVARKALLKNAALKAFAAKLSHVSTGRHVPVEWLIRLCNANVPVLLTYAELDPGLKYLNDQMAKGLCKQVRQPFKLQTYNGLGHLAEGPSARTLMFRDIAVFFATMDFEASNRRAKQIERPFAIESATKKIRSRTVTSGKWQAVFKL